MKKMMLVFSDESYITAVARRRKSCYIRAILDARIERLRLAVQHFSGITTASLADLINASGLPAREAYATEYGELADRIRDEIDLLAEECHLTGLRPDQLLAILDARARA